MLTVNTKLTLLHLLLYSYMMPASLYFTRTCYAHYRCCGATASITARRPTIRPYLPSRTMLSLFPLVRGSDPTAQALTLIQPKTQQSKPNTKIVATLAPHLGPNQPGTATVFAYFMHPRHGANQTFQVSDVPARVSSIAVAISNSLPESYGFGRFATITDVWFDDGSSVKAIEEFTCASTLDDETYVLGARLISPTHAWPPPSDIATGGLGMQGGSPIVNLSSSDPAAVTLAASVAGGIRHVVVTTLANRDAPIDITATATCGGAPVKGKANFVANLAPSFLDVDLGSSPPPSKASHAPPDLQFMQSGALLQVGVYANVAGVKLINFQVLRFSRTTHHTSKYCSCCSLTALTALHY